MKSCPKCGNRYSDDTLAYCLQDGTVLTSDAEAETPTVVLGETETVVSHSSGDRFQIPITDPGRQQYQQSQVTSFAPAQTNRGGSKVFWAVAATIMVMLVVFSVAGVAIFMFVRNGQPEPARNANTPADQSNNNVSTNYNSPATTSATPIVSPSTAKTATPMPPLPPPTDNDERSRGEVTQRIYGWKSMLESRDLNGYMDNYASTVDYYRRRNASIGEVRADKARAFSLYDSMRTDISNMTVSVSASGDTAVAAFDKEWNFRGRDMSSGKVRSQITLKKINGRWLITSERDLKVYYTR